MNKALVRRHIEDWLNRKDLRTVCTDVAEDFIDHDAPLGTPPGPLWLKHWFRTLHQVVPDLRVTIENLIADDDCVTTHQTWRGTHTGRFLGLAPTGKPFVLTNVVIWRIANGKLKERWGLDQASLRRQLQSAP